MGNDTNLYEEISSSDEETIISENQFSELMLELEKDLERLKDDSDEDLSDHFKELKRLKKTATKSVISIKEVTGFLETDIFALMVELPESFSSEPLTIYKCMLERVDSFSKSVYQEHLQVLLDLKNDEIKDFILSKEESKQLISVVSPFFSILCAERTKKRAYSESNIFSPKRVKLLSVISPLALPSCSSSEQVSDERHESLVRPGMKLI